MKQFLFMDKILDLVSDGDFFKKIFGWALRIIAVFIGIGGLLMFVGGWLAIGRMNIRGVIGGIFYQTLLVIAIYMIIHTILIRASNLEELSTQDFTMIPIVSLGFKLMGEVYAIFTSVMAIAGGIVLWFAGYLARDLMILLPLMPFGRSIFRGGANFLGGIVFMVIGIFFALVILLFFYFLSELILVLANIAKDTKLTAKLLDERKDI